MKLAADLIDKDAHKEFRRFFNNTGQTTWEKKIAKIDGLSFFPSPSPNLYRNYLANRNPLTSVIAAFLKIDREGKQFRKHADAQLMKSCWYLKIINNLIYQNNAVASQKIKSIVEDDETIRSFLFELDIATHFFRNGHDIQFVDLENQGNFDLLVSDGQSELEVECKTKSADAGRKITRANFYLLCDVMAADLAPLTESFAILVKCDGRLSGKQELFHDAAAEIKRCRVNQQTSAQVDTLSFEITPLPPDTKIRTNEEAAAAVAPHLSADVHQQYFILSGPQTLILACESTDKDRVLKAIYEDLKHGAGQLSGTRPSLLACQLEDIDDEDWDELRSGTGLAAMSGRLLGSANRRHVNRVVYSSDQTLPQDEGGFVNFFATNLGFENNNAAHSFPQAFLKAQLT